MVQLLKKNTQKGSFFEVKFRLCFRETQRRHWRTHCASSRGFSRLVKMDHGRVGSGRGGGAAGQGLLRGMNGARLAPKETHPEPAPSEGRKHLAHRALCRPCVHFILSPSPCWGPDENRTCLGVASSKLPVLWLCLCFELASQGSSQPGRDQHLWWLVLMEKNNSATVLNQGLSFYSPYFTWCKNHL